MFLNPISILKFPAGDHFNSILIQRFYELFYSYIYVKCKRKLKQSVIYYKMLSAILHFW